MLVSGPAWASFVTVARFDRGGGAYGGQNLGGVAGGEFQVTFGVLDTSLPSLVGNISWLPQAHDAKVFCVELSENINLAPNNATLAQLNANNVYKVRFSDRAVAGGVITGGDAFNGDPVSNLTKTIYNNWLGNRTNDGGANDVQQAIWKEEENRAPVNAGGSTIANVNALLATSPQAGLNNIQIMNVFTFGTTNALVQAFDAKNSATWAGMGRVQDQVIRLNSQVPGVIPEPASFALFACGLVGCCGFLRRRA